MLTKKLVIAICLFAFASPIFAQNMESTISKDEQDKLIAKVEAENPKLAKFQKRLLELNETINAIVGDYTNGKRSKEEAKAALRPLLKEQIEMLNNSEFLVEQQMSALLSEK